VLVVKDGHLKLLALLNRHRGNLTVVTTKSAQLLSPIRSLEKYFLVFVIPSLPGHVDLRNAIRRTWPNISSWHDLLSGIEEDYKSIKLMFIIGSELTYRQDFLQELAFHDDDMFIIDNLVENRDSLKYKVLWGMQQAIHRYEFSYLIKTDDDIVVNLPLLISELMTLPRERYYTGDCRMSYGGFRKYHRW
jgi:hypothetical protein